MCTEKRKRGDWGEDIAVSFLTTKGYNIETRNFQTKNRKGEIDIIISGRYDNKPMLGYVEVKTRKYDDGSAERAMSKEKIKKIIMTAKEYCALHDDSIDVDHTIMRVMQVVVCGDQMNYSIKMYDVPTF